MIATRDKALGRGTGFGVGKPGEAAYTITSAHSHAVYVDKAGHGEEEPKVYGLCSLASNSMKSANPNSGIYEADTARTLDLNGGNPVCNQGGMLVVQPALIEMTSTKNTVVEDGICPTLTARMGTGGNQVNAVIDSRKADEGSAPICIDVGFFNSTKETAPPLLARQYKDPPLLAWQYKDPPVEHWEQYARRLTELECERLQGFPDYWTDIGNWVDSKGKTRNSSSQKRYEAIGNSIALPFWFWLMRRISAQYPRPATLGSLFDGIGGFPLVWERCNGKGTAIWASEIEEFCIAVTKKHFPEEKNDG